MAKKTKRKAKKKDLEGVDLRKLPKDERPKPTTGQSAPERKISWEDLSADEQTVIKLLNDKGEGKRVARSVEYLADAFGGDNPKLTVRNSLRRPVPSGWVDREGRGLYSISEKGRKRLGSVEA